MDATPEQIAQADSAMGTASVNAAATQNRANEIAQAGVAAAEQGNAAQEAANARAANVEAEMGPDDGVTVDDFINGYLGDY